MTHFLDNAFPALKQRLATAALAELPTPVSRATLRLGESGTDIWIKHDELCGLRYGGNKVRKLDYILPHAASKNARRIATFGAAGSNHALATSLYARALGFECTCLLSHQPGSKKTADTLRAHLANDTEIVYFGGNYRARTEILRRNLQGRSCWVVPMGGSSWLGTVGFVNAALELAAQIEDGELPVPDNVYVATGTMGTAAGLALGFALAGLPTRLHAIQVTDSRFSSPAALTRLIAKTATMLRLHGAAIPAAEKIPTKVVFRRDFFAGGYAKSDAATEHAVAIAASDANLTLETTYTGKAMTALLHDLEQAQQYSGNALFWNTFNKRPMCFDADENIDRHRLPPQFHRYLDLANKH